MACLWETTPSDVFQTACKMILASLPHRYHVVLSKSFTQTFQTHSGTCVLGALGTCLEAYGYNLQKVFSAEVNGSLPEREKL